MPEFVERIQRVVEEYPELEDVSDEALEAFAQAAGLNVADEIQEMISEETEGSEERLEELLEQRPDNQ
ncbi:hypothetical protein [Haloplanus natans]|uniref:hypothetical protein n=1 Tax=Haloplanus natans TaxID=376171 RepID=UPI000677C73D|nr:hypothetical protein [Haloplanus natans]